MKTIYFVLPHGGSRSFTHLRLSLPWKHLSKELLEEGIQMEAGPFDLKNLPTADAIVFGNVGSFDYYHALPELKKRCRIVWQLDDNYWEIPEASTAKDYISNVEIALLDFYLKAADQIWVTTKPLINRCGHPGKARIVPNAVDMQDYPAFKQRKNRDVLWVGSATHCEDLELVAHVPAQQPNRKFVFVGCLPDSLKDFSKVRGRETIRIKPTLPNVGHVPLIEFDKYQTTFNDLTSGAGIGICPLEANSFNECKSNLKYLEFAAAGLPVLASDVGPYRDVIKHGVNGWLVDDWSEALNDNHDYSTTAEAGYEHVKEHWSWQCQTIRETWKNAIRDVFKTGACVVQWGSHSPLAT